MIADEVLNKRFEDLEDEMKLIKFDLNKLIKFNYEEKFNEIFAAIGELHLRMLKIECGVDDKQ